MSPDAVVAAVRARGSDASDLRDAIHEAHHAVRAGVRRPWRRERIHAKLLRLPMVLVVGPAALIVEEATARAVERLACEQFGIPYDVSKWAMMASMETTETLGIGLDLDWWMSHIDKRMNVARVELPRLLRVLAKRT